MAAQTELDDWFAYRVDPIDWHWNDIETVAKFVSRRGAENVPEQFHEALMGAGAVAYQHGWRTNMIDGPCVLWLPAPDCFQYGFVFKEANNGSTYVISPFPLGYLDQFRC